MKDHHITRATAFKNQSTIPKATFIEIGVNQKRKTKKTKKKKKKKEKTRGTLQDPKPAPSAPRDFTLPLQHSE